MKRKSLLKDRRIHVIFSITLVAVMGVASITPALPKMAQVLNLTETEVGWLISIFTLPGIFLTPVTGALADQWGRKIVLVPSLFLFAIAGFAIFFVREFSHILILRAIQGMGASALGALNTTLIGDFFKGKHRPEVMGYNASVLSICTASYPLVGGLLAGIAWYYPFVLPLMAIPVGLFVIFGIKEPQIEKLPNFSRYMKEIATNIFRKEVIAIFILSLLTFVILYGAFLTYLPFLLHDTFNLSAPQIGFVLSLSSVVTAIFASQAGKLTAKYGSLNLLKIAFLFYFIVCISIPHQTNLYIFMLPILLFGAAQALNIPSLHTAVANMAPDNLRGAFMSVNGMVLRIGQTVGPLIIGIGYTIHGLTGAYYLSAAIAIIGLVVLFTMLNSQSIKGGK